MREDPIPSASPGVKKYLAPSNSAIYPATYPEPLPFLPQMSFFLMLICSLLSQLLVGCVNVDSPTRMLMGAVKRRCSRGAPCNRNYIPRYTHRGAE